MSRSVVSRGKSVNEAVSIGLDLLNTSKKNVDIEIISTERKGVLGIGFKPAVVKLVIKTAGYDIRQDINIEQLLEGTASREETVPVKAIAEKPVVLKGKVWIKNGSIGCQNSSTQYPTITPMKGVTLYKNGQAYNETVIIKEGDSISVDLPSEKTDASWEVKVDEKKLQAKLYVKPGKEVVRTLSDHPPTDHLELRVNESVLPINDLKPEDIISHLSECGIVYGVNYTEIFNACRTTREEAFVIAAGLEPQPGTNGFIEFVVSLDDGIKMYDDQEDAVDFREVRSIPTVQKGDVIAYFHKPQPGKPGVTVTGEPIGPDSVYPVSIQTGKGVTVIEEDRAVVATSAGRPQVQARGQLVKISVLPKLLHSSDVDLSSGNIRFTGDIEVTGEIQEEMEVKGKGSVIVHGIVNRAKVTAGSSLYIKNNVIGSDISAGHSNMAMAEMKKTLEEIVSQLDNLIVAIKQVYRSPVFKMSDYSKMGMSSLIRILLESKFKNFSTTVKTFVIYVSSHQDMFDDDWKLLSDRLYRSFVILHPNEVRDLADLERMKADAAELYALSDCPVVPNCTLTIPYALNSNVYSSGDVSVYGQGCYHTKIFAEGKVTVNGFFRGGEIFASEGVEVEEVGAKGGVPTVITVGSDQTIKFGKVYEDTTIVIGKKRYKFNTSRENVVAHLDRNEKIVFI